MKIIVHEGWFQIESETPLENDVVERWQGQSPVMTGCGTYSDLHEVRSSIRIDFKDKHPSQMKDQ